MRGGRGEGGHVKQIKLTGGGGGSHIKQIVKLTEGMGGGGDMSNKENSLGRGGGWGWGWGDIKVKLTEEWGRVTQQAKRKRN